jgi:hypothetical protein
VLPAAPFAAAIAPLRLQSFVVASLQTVADGTSSVRSTTKGAANEAAPRGP